MAHRWLRSWRTLSAARQDVIIALCTCAGAIALIAADLGVISGADDPHRTTRVLLVVGMGAAQTLRRRAPLVGLGAGVLIVGIDAALGTSVPVLVILTDLVYAAVLHTSARQSAAVVRGVVATGVVIAVLTAFLADEWRMAAFVVLLYAAMLVSPMLTALVVRQHRDQVRREQQHVADAQRIAELDRAAAVSEERNRVARDLHDVISGHLTAIALQGEALGRLAPTDQRRSQVVGQIREQSLQALTAMRELIGALQDEPRPATPSGLAELFDHLGRRVAASGAHLQVSAITWPALDPEVAASVGAVASEAITNALKHAPRQDISVSGQLTDGELQIAISNGLPPDYPPPRAGQGLANMRHRITTSGGRFRAGPVGGRWQVSATVPAGLVGSAR